MAAYGNADQSDWRTTGVCFDAVSQVSVASATLVVLYMVVILLIMGYLLYLYLYKSFKSMHIWIPFSCIYRAPGLVSVSDHDPDSDSEASIRGLQRLHSEQRLAIQQVHCPYHWQQRLDSFQCQSWNSRNKTIWTMNDFFLFTWYVQVCLVFIGEF